MNPKFVIELELQVEMCPGPYFFLIGTLNAPNVPPRVVPWPCVPSTKHKNTPIALVKKILNSDKGTLIFLFPIFFQVELLNFQLRFNYFPLLFS